MIDWFYSAGSYTNERMHQLNRADSDKMLAINLQAFEQVFSWASKQLKQQSQPLDIVNNNITNSNATHKMVPLTMVLFTTMPLIT